MKSYIFPTLVVLATTICSYAQAPRTLNLSDGRTDWGTGDECRYWAVLTKRGGSINGHDIYYGQLDIDKPGWPRNQDLEIHYNPDNGHILCYAKRSDHRFEGVNPIPFNYGGREYFKWDGTVAVKTFDGVKRYKATWLWPTGR